MSFKIYFMSFFALWLGLCGSAMAANSSKEFNQEVKSLFERHNFQVVSYSKYHKNPDKYQGRVLLTRVPYTSVFDRKGWTDYLAIDKNKNVEIRLESIFQKPRSLQDYKVQNWFIHAVDRFPEKRQYIVLGNPDGADRVWDDAKNWVAKSLEEKRFIATAEEANKAKEIKTFSLSELETFLKSTLLN